MMKIVIDIDEEIYNHMKERFMYAYTNTELDKVGLAVRNGIPLPNGHGRLIDADDIDNHIIGHVDTRSCPTIIEADRK